MLMKKDIFIGVTKENKLFKLEVEQASKDHNYFAISYTSYRLIEEEQAKAEAEERLKDGEVWRMTVESRNTNLGLNDWVDYVLSTDGWESQFDIDFGISPIDYQGVNYYFDFSSGGQGQEYLRADNFKHLFISERSVEILSKMWKKYHLKKPELPHQTDLKEYLLPDEYKQNKDEILKKAVEVMTTLELSDIPF